MKPTIFTAVAAVMTAFAAALTGAAQDPEGPPSLVILYTSDTNGQFEACD